LYGVVGGWRVEGDVGKKMKGIGLTRSDDVELFVG
jgi:hypothetical protein